MPFVYLPKIDSVMVRIPKTATTSILRSGLHAETKDLVPVMQLCENMRTKFRFAFVRNPFDRLVSCLQMFQKHSLAVEAGFNATKLTLDHVMDVVEDDRIDIYGDDYWCKMRRHAMPMTHPHFRIEEVNFTGRFEQLDSDWQKLCKALTVDYVSLEKLKHANRKAHYSTFYSEQQRVRAASIFSRDLKEFGYEFEAATNEKLGRTST